jgi:RNA polymerase sigma-70 factor (ECF subfamily)
MSNRNSDIGQHRSMLFSIAYNMLGSFADAEDMVQETFVSWASSDKSHVEVPKFYLIRTITNKCIDHLKKLKQQREQYTGTWLPEPIEWDDDVLELSKKLILKIKKNPPGACHTAAVPQSY